MNKQTTDIERIEIVKNFLNEPSLLALSRRLGMPNAQIFYDIRAKKCGISKELILKIEHQIPGINHAWLLTGNGEMMLSEKNVSQVGEVNSSPGGVVQNIANNGNGNVEANANTAPSTEPTFAEVLQQLVATNAKLVETNAQLVAMLNNK